MNWRKKQFISFTNTIRIVNGVHFTTVLKGPERFAVTDPFTHIHTLMAVPLPNTGANL